MAIGQTNSKLPDPNLKEIFVGQGRFNKIEQFAQILQREPDSKVWIVEIAGYGGMGKSRMLDKLRDKVRELAEETPGAYLAPDRPIDFYFATNRTVEGLLFGIAQALGTDDFGTFLREWNRFYGGPEPVDLVLKKEADEYIENAFIKDYTALLRGENTPRVMLAFDTCEELRGASERILSALTNLILQAERLAADEPALSHPWRTTLVFAGRQQSLPYPESVKQAGEFEVWTLAKFDQNDIAAFFRERSMGSVAMDDQIMRRILDLSAGRPMYVALIYDWLKYGISTPDEIGRMIDGLRDSEHPFGQQLVSWVKRLPGQMPSVILFAAVAWRRLEPSLLARLLGVDTDQAQQAMDALAPYSFIKYTPALGGKPANLQLQDEFRRLVTEYILPGEGMLPARLLDEIIPWYEAQIGTPQYWNGQEYPRSNDMRALLAELLYFRASKEADAAIRDSEPLFTRCLFIRDIDYCDLLNDEIGRFQARLSPSHLLDYEFRQAMTLFHHEKIDESRRRFEWLLDQPELRPMRRAIIYMQLTEMLSRSAPEKATEYAEEGVRILTDLANREPDEPYRTQQIYPRLGELYNNWGFCYRIKGDYDAALHYYDQALENYDRFPNRANKEKNRARTLNNKAYVEYLKGDLLNARVTATRALRMRERQKPQIPYEMGLSYNTLGMILEESGRLEEAAEHYHKALASFDEAIPPSQRGKALVYNNLGRIYRRVRDFDGALRYLLEARDIFIRANDRDSLIDTWNEIGCTYRDRGMSDDFEAARTALETSIDFCIAFRNETKRADSLEDLSALYRDWALELQRTQRDGPFTQYVQRALEYAQEAEEVAEALKRPWLKGKIAFTRGELKYEFERDFDGAFDLFFDACHTMLAARVEFPHAAVLLQRRYEQMLDKLQARLLSLRRSSYTNRQAQRLLDENFEALPPDIRRKADATHDVLTTVIKIVKKYPQVEDPTTQTE